MGCKISEHMVIKKWFDDATESVLRRSILKSPIRVHILFSDVIFCSKGSMCSLLNCSTEMELDK